MTQHTPQLEATIDSLNLEALIERIERIETYANEMRDKNSTATGSVWTENTTWKLWDEIGASMADCLQRIEEIKHFG